MNIIQQPQISVMNGAPISRMKKQKESDTLLIDLLDIQPREKKTLIVKRKEEASETLKKVVILKKDGVKSLIDPEADGRETAGEEEVKEALSRPPPVNSDYLPLPWKGRLGYVRYQRQRLKAQAPFG